MTHCTDGPCSLNVIVFDGAREIITSMHRFTPGEHTYRDLIHSVAYQNVTIVSIDPKNTFLEAVSPDNCVVTLNPADPIDPSHRMLELQIGLSRRILVRATILKEGTNTLGKIANIMYASLTKTDGLSILVAGHKVGSNFVIWQYYLEFAKRRLHATVKSYFENYYGAVSIARASARDAVVTRGLFMGVELDPTDIDHGDAIVSPGAARVYCPAVQRRLQAAPLPHERSADEEVA